MALKPSTALLMPYAEASGDALGRALIARDGVVLTPAQLPFRRGRPSFQQATTLPGTFAVLDLLRGGVRRLPRSQRASSWLMYRVHGQFDRAAARYATREGFGCLVGYPGSMERTMLATPNAVHVINMVNGTPRAHNDALAALGLPNNHHEFVPPAVAFKVERELHMADLVLCPSQSVKQQLTEIGVAQTKIHVQPYGYPSTTFSRRDAGPNMRVLFMGQVGWRKGVDLVLQVARLLPRAEFTIVGPLVSPEVLAGLPLNVRVLSEVAQSEVRQLMATAHVLLLPTREDSFALVVTEALSVGLPVVVSARAGSSEIVTPESGRVIDSLEPSRYAEALDALQSDGWAQWLACHQSLETLPRGASWEHFGNGCLDAITQISRDRAQGKGH